MRCGVVACCVYVDRVLDSYTSFYENSAVDCDRSELIIICRYPWSEEMMSLCAAYVYHRGCTTWMSRLVATLTSELLSTILVQESLLYL